MPFAEKEMKSPAPKAKSYSLRVIDGPIPPDAFQSPDMEPNLSTDPDDQSVFQELLQREPLFHRPEFGVTRADFEKLAAPKFWEVGASGRPYSRKFVLDTLEKRYQHPSFPTWELRDAHCLQIAPDCYLFTYVLVQGDRTTRRATIWRRTPGGWQIVYHQGTTVA